MNNNVSIANFNVTFGKKENPLLYYFDDIVMPAFKSGLKREYKITGTNTKDKYYFLNTKVVDAGNEDLVLMGQFVRETELEVKSVVTNNELVSTDEHYPSAPYSVFYIFLKNHRMILIKNQKGSPGIKSFGVTSRSILNKYIHILNTEKREKKEQEYPDAIVNVVGIPLKDKLEEVFRDITQVNKLVLRFYPLNGDLNLTPVTESITRDIRIPAGANTGSLTLNKCDNKAGVIDIIDGLQGVMEPLLDVNFEYAKGVKLKNNQLTENVTWNLDQETINNPEVIIPKAKKLDSIKTASDDNIRIYNKFLHKIKKWV